MGLASSQVTLLMLTSRKADCEYDIAIASNRKMSLAREASSLSQQYYQKLNTKNLAYYANGRYNNINYEYLMGYGSDVDNRFMLDGFYPCKSDLRTVLTDYKGRVVLDPWLADLIKSTTGVADGGTFSIEKYLAELISKAIDIPDADTNAVKTVLNNKDLTGTGMGGSRVDSSSGNSLGLETISTDTAVQAQIVNCIRFYKPIFTAAATNGWTTEYNAQMKANDKYLGDALASGVFQLAQVYDNGSYYEDTSLTYFITSGVVQEQNDSDHREEVTAWYEAEKSIINDKETQLDVFITELSTELEAIKTEMESIQTFIDDAIGTVFDWGAG